MFGGTCRQRLRIKGIQLPRLQDVKGSTVPPSASYHDETALSLMEVLQATEMAPNDCKLCMRWRPCTHPRNTRVPSPKSLCLGFLNAEDGGLFRLCVALCCMNLMLFAVLMSALDQYGALRCSLLLFHWLLNLSLSCNLSLLKVIASYCLRRGLDVSILHLQYAQVSFSRTHCEIRRACRLGVGCRLSHIRGMRWVQPEKGRRFGVR